MKNVINGKTYNSNTALTVAIAIRKLPEDHPYFQTEALFKKEDGEYFLMGTGNELTFYSKIHNGVRVKGETQIRPLTQTQENYWVKTRKTKGYRFSVLRKDLL